ncbi:MAG: bifunctional demethylmenaquinone methyltransferase/2-methoxy-6-polyprenyl-1,4-benzoquinol methylase UbiE [Prevotella sp.]|nr:bifunctional demethylmenaquinone methyltransferase/2-methoxy-6-polyprenyl-1,4-benzoquinol methylase UbiE [Candidatus Prevotella equi]
MYKQETIKPYSQHGEKSQQVETMFDNIAPTYDTLNHRLSWDIDKTWRKRAIKELRHFNPKTILDVATGTGDFAILAAKKIRPTHDNPLLGKDLRIIGADISEGMMDIGRQKVQKKGLEDIITFAKEDCCNLSFEENSFDAVMASFGIRNFQNLEKGLSEMLRVLKPGGMLCILELTTPVSFPMKQLFRIYSHTVLPIYGKLISKDTSAYSYLTKTIEAFPQGETMMEILKGVGFKETTFKRLTFGICTLYIAYK